MQKINFIGNSKKYFVISAVLIVVALLGSFARGVNLDIQFRGGSILTYTYDSLNIAEFERTIQDLTETDISLQRSTDLSTGRETVVVTLPGNEGMDADRMVQVSDGLREAFPDSNLQMLESSNVDPVMGREFLAKSLTAVGVAALLMVVYVWLRFRRIGGLSAGLMAVVALVHDIIITFGVFIILGMSVNDNFIAVILTILGYSLNDTIVIYDRIRENERKMGSKADVAELVNLSINQSFKRSMVTSITTVTVMIVVSIVAAVYNVNSILSFSLPLVFGLAAGNYSSICIAGPLWVQWQQRKQRQNGVA